MKSRSVNLSRHMPILRPFVSEITHLCNRFESTVTLERDHIILNLKSIIGLLSQKLPADGVLTLIVDGPDEEAAFAAICEVLQEE